MAKKKKEMTIKDVVDIFLPKLWIILLVGIIVAGAVGIYSFFIKDDTYTASAEVYIFKSSEDTTANDITTAEMMVNVYERAVRGNLFLEYVSQELYKNTEGKYDLTDGQIRSLVELSKVEDTPTLIISVTSDDENLSNELAKAIVNQLRSRNITDDPSIESTVFHQPVAARNGKNTVRNTIISFIVGILVAAIVVWVKNSFDVIIRNAKKIEDTLDIPVLGIIPKHDVTLNAGGNE